MSPDALEAPAAMVAAGCLEQPLVMSCGGEQLLGILSGPDAAHGNTSDLGVLVVVGGPQYRAGSHRLFVRLCRHLAAQGITALRFDVRGMGDSTGGQRSFEHLSDDIAAAIDALQRARPAIRRVVLWGLCDAASAALLYCHERVDGRVAGLCLLNPWVRSEATLARTHLKHYYLQRLREPAFWRKLLNGQVAGKAARELWRNLRLARAAGVADKRAAHMPPNASAGIDLAAEMQRPSFERMALGLQRFASPTWLVLSGQDLTAREFEEVSRAHPAWLAALARPEAVRVSRLPGADHTLSSGSDAQQHLQEFVTWLESSLTMRTQMTMSSIAIRT